MKIETNLHINLDLLQQVEDLFMSIQNSDGHDLLRLTHQIDDIEKEIYSSENNTFKLKTEKLTLNHTSINTDLEKDKKGIGRKLLSIKEEDSDQLEEDNHDFKKDIEDEVYTEGYDYDDEDVDDFDLLDEESLESMLRDYTNLTQKLQVINELIDTLEIKIAMKDNEDLQISAVQTLVVYLFAFEELEAELNNASMQDQRIFKRLNLQLQNLKKVYLRQVSQFENFLEKAWSLFLKMMDENGIQTQKRNYVINLINEFVFNYHYASEIEKLIIRRDIPEELDMISGGSEDLTVLTKFYKSLGVETEVHDEGYFSQVLKGFVSDGDDEELESTFPSRRLLSVQDEELDGHCSKEDPNCETENKSIFSDLSGKSISTTHPPRKTTVEYEKKEFDNSKSGLERCKDFLIKTEDFSNKRKEGSLNMGEMSSKQKVKAIKTFLLQMKESRQMLEEYKNIQESIADPQEYQKCHKMLNKALAAIQSQASNTKWMGHLTSLMASNDPQVLHELKNIMTATNQEETKQNQFQSRKLLSITDDIDGSCQKDDPDCDLRQAGLYLPEDNMKEKQQDDELIIPNSSQDPADELKKELDDALEESKTPKNSNFKSNDIPAVERCQALLSASNAHLKESRKDKTLKKMKTMTARQKVRALKTFMRRMTASKELLDEYQDIASSMKDHSDIQLCQPILKKAMENLAEIQTQAGSTEWMSHMTSLLGSDDPDVLAELNEIMASEI